MMNTARARPQPPSVDDVDAAELARLGVVVIGRNEGERLRHCLASIVNQVERVVYVDSRSTDGSLELARGFGVEVCSLDSKAPLTAGRARNLGFAELVGLGPDLKWVQFVDGDCELAPGWLSAAIKTLQRQPDVAIVVGRLRERYPDKTRYNRLCDLEWDTPLGEVISCGGVALGRICAFAQVNGFRPDLIAGEEPELCVRLRRRGWKIVRIDAEMALHDADMTRFGQWWRRSRRAGHAYAEGAALHGRTAERFNVRHVRSAVFWGLIAPLAAVVTACAALAAVAWVWLGLVFWAGGYGLLMLRIYRHRRRRGDSARFALLYAAFCVLAKVPQCVGVLQYHLDRLRDRRPALIEYKDLPPSHAVGADKVR